MKIALDVDGVLADVIVSWINYSNLIRPDISKNQVTDWEFWKKFDIDPFDFYSELSSCWKNWQSIPTTQKNLSDITKNLSTLGQVDIVTARERDSPLNAIKFLENNKKVILYSQPWNQHISNNKIFRISNLSQAIEKIKSC